MIPPLLLDVSSDHLVRLCFMRRFLRSFLYKVLDMCAAPGSKVHSISIINHVQVFKRLIRRPSCWKLYTERHFNRRKFHLELSLQMIVTSNVHIYWFINLLDCHLPLSWSPISMLVVIQTYSLILITTRSSNSIEFSAMFPAAGMALCEKI